MISSAFYCLLLSLLSSPISASSVIDEPSWINSRAHDFDSELSIPNDRLQNAYVALQAWKKAIISDPNRITANWVGPNVCSYTGIFCAPAPDDPKSTVVAGIDIIAADLTGTLAPELGLLADLALIHLNSNRLSGAVPSTFTQLKRLFELDVSNNRFSSPFPSVVLDLPSLKFLDLRYNTFTGPIPAKLFDLPLDAIFLNNNRFDSKLPYNIGHSNASVIVLANNNLTGCIPSSVGDDMKTSVNEILLNNNGLGGCLPPEIGRLQEAVVVDVSGNRFSGRFVPESGSLGKVEEIDVSGNRMVGAVPEWVCELRSLKRFSVEENFFEGVGRSCEEARKRGVMEDSGNCLPGAKNQRARGECNEVTRSLVVCDTGLCGGSGYPKLSE